MGVIKYDQWGFLIPLDSKSPCSQYPEVDPIYIHEDIEDLIHLMFNHLQPNKTTTKYYSSHLIELLQIIEIFSEICKQEGFVELRSGEKIKVDRKGILSIKIHGMISKIIDKNDVWKYLRVKTDYFLSTYHLLDYVIHIGLKTYEVFNPLMEEYIQKNWNQDDYIFYKNLKNKQKIEHLYQEFFHLIRSLPKTPNEYVLDKPLRRNLRLSDHRCFSIFCSAFMAKTFDHSKLDLTT